MENEIPENTVLSHDLLEGCYLRCGLIGDVQLLDGFPSKYISYISRNHRWVRGDWQISKWLKNPKLNSISKFKIFDNLRRSLIKPIAFIGIIFSLLLKNKLLFLLNFFGLEIMYIIEFVNMILFKQSNIKGALYSNKNFYNKTSSGLLALLRLIFDFIFLPFEAFENIDAIIRVLYRKKHKTKLLEWATSESVDKETQNKISVYYRKMYFQIISGIIAIICNSWVIGTIWIVSPMIAYYLSKDFKKQKELTNEEKGYLKEIAKDTWGFFLDNINTENNYLIVDNYQEDRNNKVVNRTSSTNIGLELISIISAYDIGLIDLKETVNYLQKIIDTVNKLSKWNGHLYNWYDTTNLKPLEPRYISTVDSGNFVGYLIIVKEFLKENLLKIDVNNLILNIEELIDRTDFSKLYNDKTKLLSVGYNLEDNCLTDSYYDFLASEARQASLVAIAKRDVPLKHWNNLSRTLTVFKGYKGLVSWTGTAFEYLMPNLNLKKYAGSLIEESSHFAILSQIEYCKRFGIPWGISESAYNTKDFKFNYQYKAFGIPWLGLKRGLEEDLVISPYSTCLALTLVPKKSIENLKLLEKYNARGKYGFYESIDFTPNRLKKGKNYEVVKTYMAHHQGLIFNSINNVINNNILERRFNKDEKVESVNILLQEKMPIKMIITKTKKKKIEKLKNENHIGYYEREIENVEFDNRNINIISNENYKIFIDNFGNGYSQYKDILINEYKETDFGKQGICFYAKYNKKITRLEENCKVLFAPDKSVFSKIDGNIKYETKITINPNYPVEIRKVTIENVGNTEEIVDFYSELIPILSSKMQHYSHPEFNRMFLRIEKNGEDFVIKRTNLDGSSLYLAVNLFTEDEQIVEKSFEFEREKYFGRENLDYPIMIKSEKSFSNYIEDGIDKIIAFKNTVKIKPKETAQLALILSVNESKEDAIEFLKQSKGIEEINKIFDLSRLRAEEELKYLQLGREQLVNSRILLDYIYKPKNKKAKDFYESYDLNNIWKFSISGDLPIILFEIESLEEIYILEEFLNIYLYYRMQSIFIDLVIVVREKKNYENFISQAIYELIENKQLGYLNKIKSGFFVLNIYELSDKDLEFLKYISKLIINGKKGNLSFYISELKNENIDTKKLELKVFCDEVLPNVLKEEAFYNGYGGFINNGKEYIFAVNKNQKLPAVWSNVLSNRLFGTIVTENMSNTTWSKNCRLNRLTPWINDSVKNVSSEVIFVYDNAKKRMWSLNSGILPNENLYYTTFGFGYAKYKNITDGLLQETTIHVPLEDKIKITDIRVKNLYSEERDLDIIFYTGLLIGEDESLTNENLLAKLENNIVYIKNVVPTQEFRDDIMYISTNYKIKKIARNKSELFIDEQIDKPYKVLKEPKDKIFFTNGIAISINLKLKAFEEKQIEFEMGMENNDNSINKALNKYITPEGSRYSLNNTISYWENLLNTLIINTPSKELNYLVNGWIPYQIISSRIFARGSFYQSGGAIGFRDQLQDCLGIKYIKPDLLRDQILKCCRHQFVEGDVLHWWHEETKRGIRTKFSDDLLWLVYCTIEYVIFTNDYEFLNEEVEYLVGDELDNCLEKYDVYYSGKEKGTVYEHCIKAIERSLKFGENGFPKIGSGDWNDGFSNIGPKGNGESVWLGFFLYDILNRFEKIMEVKEDYEHIERYRNIKNELKKKLNSNGWDGKWYKRAIDDDGNVIGGIESQECKIDSISQSWAIISDCGDNDKKYICLNSAENYLVDNENKLIKLFTPAFESTELNPGYIKSYPSGVRENGGQYTHGALWLIMAFFRLGMGDRGFELLDMINPINHTKNFELISKYKKEPYVIAADVYSGKGMEGRGGWTWYTGSASWFYKVVIEELIGMKIENGYLKFNPCIPKDWKSFEIHYKFKTSMYNIKINNFNSKNNGVEKVVIDNEEIKEKKVYLQNNGKIYNVEIFM